VTPRRESDKVASVLNLPCLFAWISLIWIYGGKVIQKSQTPNGLGIVQICFLYEIKLEKTSFCFSYFTNLKPLQNVTGWKQYNINRLQIVTSWKTL
jgi:hypothetical protein